MRPDPAQPRRDVEIVESGPLDGGQRDGHRSRVRRWLPGVLAVVVAGGLVGLVQVTDDHVASTPPSASPSPTSVELPPDSTGTTIRLGRPLLPTSGGWDVLVRGDRAADGYGRGVVARIDPAHGRISRTTIPALRSSGAVSFVARDGDLIVSPFDDVPGYVIRVGQPAREITRTSILGVGGPVLPGPKPNQVWVAEGRGRTTRMVLVADGHKTGTSMSVPAGAWQVSSDQDGYLFYRDSTGTYDLRPGRRTLLTRGTVLAVGPTRWLVSRCRHHHECTTILVNRTNGARSPLPVRSADAENVALPGVVSPDATTAAVLLRSPYRIETIDLNTGAERRLPLKVESADVGAQTMAFSPDSRWLLVIADQGTLYAVDTATGAVSDLTAAAGGGLPRLRQLVIGTVGDAPVQDPSAE